MQKKSFFNRQSCAVTLLCKPTSATQAMALVRAAECDGADAFAIEIQKLPQTERTVDNFRNIIGCAQLPGMFIDYRDDIIHGADDEARQQYLLMAAEAGAEVIDVMGDLYNPSPRELALDAATISKQKKLIDEIHRRGAKVLISSHMTNEALSANEVLEHLQLQAARNADIVKIVTRADSEEEAAEAVRTMMLLHRKMDRPFIYLCCGKFARFSRYIGPQLGVAVEFAVHDYDSAGGYNQPTISSFRKVIDNFHWNITGV
ncbi:MAG: type I 3-dehydroquinate dehydratase [Lentisphaerae bacterium]|nr:type I 3-dehydroquinate dehydratase [Lentisphaerota bacterium]